MNDCGAKSKLPAPLIYLSKTGNYSYMYVFKRNKDTYMRKAFLHRKAKEDVREIAFIPHTVRD
jgi:hypothetical protein